MPVYSGSNSRNTTPAGVTLKLRKAMVFVLLAAALSVLPGCRSGGSRGAAVLEDSNSRVQLATAKSGNSRIDERKDDREAVRHADATRETADDLELEVAAEDGGPERPSRWSKLFDRLRPARRIPLPLSSDDPEMSLHEQLTAF